MRDYKVIQKVNNSINKSIDLSKDYKLVEDGSAIVEYAVKYFYEECPELEYPAKSYAVAIIYALLIEKYFGVNFYESLNEEDLLCNNDQFFKTYSQSKAIYDEILTKINFNENDHLEEGSERKKFDLNMNLSQIKSTVNYFLEEFSLDSKA